VAWCWLQVGFDSDLQGFRGGYDGFEIGLKPCEVRIRNGSSENCLAEQCEAEAPTTFPSMTAMPPWQASPLMRR